MRHTHRLLDMDQINSELDQIMQRENSLKYRDVDPESVFQQIDSLLKPTQPLEVSFAGPSHIR